MFTVRELSKNIFDLDLAEVLLCLFVRLWGQRRLYNFTLGRYSVALWNLGSRICVHCCRSSWLACISRNLRIALFGEFIMVFLNFFSVLTLNSFFVCHVGLSSVLWVKKVIFVVQLLVKLRAYTGKFKWCWDVPCFESACNLFLENDKFVFHLWVDISFFVCWPKSPERVCDDVSLLCLLLNAKDVVPELLENLLPLKELLLLLHLSLSQLLVHALFLRRNLVSNLRIFKNESFLCFWNTRLVCLLLIPAFWWVLRFNIGPILHLFSNLFVFRWFLNSFVAWIPFNRMTLSGWLLVSDLIWVLSMLQAVDAYIIIVRSLLLIHSFLISRCSILVVSIIVLVIYLRVTRLKPLVNIGNDNMVIVSFKI